MNKVAATGKSVSAEAGHTVNDYLQRARSAGIGWPLPEHLHEGALEALLFPPPPAVGVARHLPDFSLIHKELQTKKDVT